MFKQLFSKLRARRKRKIKVFYHSSIYNKFPLTHTGDWVDLRACDGITYYEAETGRWLPAECMEVFNEVYLKKDTLYKIPLGVAMKLPYNHEGILEVRSSTSRFTGLLKATSGVIDEGYCGHNDQWFAVMYATRNETLRIGEKIVQFRVQRKQPKLVFEEVARLTDPNRGGHGSTGRF